MKMVSGIVGSEAIKMERKLMAKARKLREVVALKSTLQLPLLRGSPRG